MNQHRPFDIQHVRIAQPDDSGTLVSSHDALFAMLDGQIIRGRRRAWRAEVVSILEERDQTWVQIGPARKPASAVVMRLAAQPRADDALQALRVWTDLPVDRRPPMIDLVGDGGVPRPRDTKVGSHVDGKVGSWSRPAVSGIP